MTKGCWPSNPSALWLPLVLRPFSCSSSSSCFTSRLQCLRRPRLLNSPLHPPLPSCWTRRSLSQLRFTTWTHMMLGNFLSSDGVSYTHYKFYFILRQDLLHLLSCTRGVNQGVPRWRLERRPFLLQKLSASWQKIQTIKLEIFCVVTDNNDLGLKRCKMWFEFRFWDQFFNMLFPRAARGSNSSKIWISLLEAPNLPPPGILKWQSF